MLGIVKEINGEKKIIPLTTDTGTGAAVGTLISQYKKVPISGYLYCDGSTFDANDYPALYMYLGTNVLPDYRECVMVGAEQNTTDTIATHDVYGEGEFKDDKLQTHGHGKVKVDGLASFGVVSGDISWSESALYSATISGASNKTISLSAGTNTGRSGETTHGKQKAVYVYIKATSGLAENQQENVLNDVKEYIRKSNELSPIEGFTLSTTNQAVQYDGFIFVYMIGSSSIKTQFYVNDEQLFIIQAPAGFDSPITIPLCKGDTIRVNRIDGGIYWTKARWYKNR